MTDEKRAPKLHGPSNSENDFGQEDPGSEPVSFRTVPWRVSDLALGVVLLLLLRTLPYLGASPAGPVLGWGLRLLPVGLLFLFPIWLAIRRQGRFFFAYPKAKKLLIEAGVAVPVVLGILLFLWLTTTLWVVITGDTVLRSNFWVYTIGATRLEQIVAAAVLSFTVVPVAEELFFRGFLYSGFCRWCPAKVAATLQAILFSMMHFHGLIGSVLLFAIGTVLAAVYDWRKTLLAPVLVHACFNFLVAAHFTVTFIVLATTPILGIHGYDSDQQIVVTDVKEGTSADRAEIEPGDVILSFDGIPVDNLDVLGGLVASQQLNQRVTVEILRNGKPLTKEVILYGRFQDGRTGEPVGPEAE